MRASRRGRNPMRLYHGVAFSCRHERYVPWVRHRSIVPKRRCGWFSGRQRMPIVRGDGWLAGGTRRHHAPTQLSLIVSDHSSGLADELQEIVGAANVITDRATLLSLCKDYSWFSPIVEAEVASWTPAELAVRPRSTQQVLAVAGAARRRGIPLTVRGG